MTWNEQLAQQRAEILCRSIIEEREVFMANFKEIKYQGRSIGDILDNQGWIGCLKREGRAFVDLVLVWEVYAALLNVVDIDAQRPIGAYLAMEMENKQDVENIFHAFIGRDNTVNEFASTSAELQAFVKTSAEDVVKATEIHLDADWHLHPHVIKWMYWFSTTWTNWLKKFAVDHPPPPFDSP
ncbi:hypothetical protein CJ030_MR5G010136 [Morella rubra]|uniref:Uncharacterized protein n=1 Tax=Morella rubra TaxID=262757 RepID=A0A6A1VLT7_9ROSI|nr:hypothetical protein CJ030_MR5G010136 [Morella rubra]